MESKKGRRIGIEVFISNASSSVMIMEVVYFIDCIVLCVGAVCWDNCVCCLD